MDFRITRHSGFASPDDALDLLLAQCHLEPILEGRREHPAAGFTGWPRVPRDAPLNRLSAQ